MSGSDATAALIPAEIRVVDFYGDQIAGALLRIAGAERIYMPVKPICEGSVSWLLL